MIRAVVVDDEPPARARLRRLLDEASDVAVVGEAGSADEARAVIRATRPDVLFLDVEMPAERGTSLAALLPEPRPFVVFATAYARYALDAIGADATGYLLKPVSRASLTATLDRVRARMARQSELERDVAAASAVQAQMGSAFAAPGRFGGALDIAGIDCAASLLPARGVGGDFCDVFELPPPGRRWAFVLGDASGKGVAAGLVASSVQARIHTAARLARLDPPALMEAVARDVYATIEGLRYATAIYAALDSTSRTVALANAGHPPALLLDARGGVRRLPSTGPALGLTPMAPTATAFATHDFTLTSGSVLVAYSDGVSEARNGDDQEFGETRLVDLVSSCRSRPAAEICARMLDQVRGYRGSRQDQDDVTALVVKAR